MVNGRIIATSLVLLTGCSTIYPVAGVVKSTGERFVGTAEATAGVSTFEITAESGVQCSGTYVADIVFDYTTGSSVKGTGKCTDGRSVTWAATGTAVGGQGFGTLGGKKFNIFYGQFASYQQLF